MAKTDAIEQFFHDGFLAALGGRAQSRRGTPASAEVASLWGTKPTPSFARLIKVRRMSRASASSWRLRRAHALRAFLHCDDTTLKAALVHAKDHPARLLQDMAKSLTAKMKQTGPEARLEALESM
jgi:hypothetical protein